MYRKGQKLKIVPVINFQLKEKNFFPVILKGRVFFYILTVVEHLPPHPKVKSLSPACFGKENGGKKFYEKGECIERAKN